MEVYKTEKEKNSFSCFSKAFGHLLINACEVLYVNTITQFCSLNPIIWRRSGTEILCERYCASKQTLFLLVKHNNIKQSFVTAQSWQSRGWGKELWSFKLPLFFEYHCLQETVILLGIHDNTSPYPEWLQTLRVPQYQLKFQRGNLSAIRRREFKALTGHSWPFTPHKTRAKIPTSSFG